jgi:hypothetical protein
MAAMLVHGRAWIRSGRTGSGVLRGTYRAGCGQRADASRIDGDIGPPGTCAGSSRPSRPVRERPPGSGRPQIDDPGTGRQRRGLEAHASEPSTRICSLAIPRSAIRVWRLAACLTGGRSGPSIRGRATSGEAGASGIDDLEPGSARLTLYGAEPYTERSAPCAAAPRRCTLTIEE